MGANNQQCLHLRHLQLQIPPLNRYSNQHRLLCSVGLPVLQAASLLASMVTTSPRLQRCAALGPEGILFLLPGGGKKVSSLADHTHNLFPWIYVCIAIINTQ